MDFILGSTASGSVDWNTESDPLFQDFMVLPIFVLFFPSLRFILDKFLFQKLARRLISGSWNGKKNSETLAEKTKLKKFKESTWKFVYYSYSELFALAVTYDEPWFTNTRFFWLGPGNQVWPEQKIKLKVKALYMSATGFYIYSVFALVFWETRRSDFAVSMAHHVASSILLLLSYMLRLSRVGCVLLVIHEGNDVFLELAKMCNYSGFQRISDLSFSVFALSWFILRLIYYPFWILWSTSYEVLMIMDKEDKHTAGATVYYCVFNALLYGLLVCHVYWWMLMMKILINKIQTRGEISDLRSDSESDDEHED